MTEQKTIKRINSWVMDYVVTRLVEKRGKSNNFPQKASFIILLNKKNTKEVSYQISSLLNTFNTNSIFTLLDKYVEDLIKDFDELDIERIKHLEFSEMTGEKVKLSEIISTTFKIVLISYSNRELGTKYPKLQELQDTILNNYKNLANELNINSSLDLSHYYTYLLWNGYFSPNKDHSYQLRDRIISYPTLEVFQGKGVCLNYSALQSAFLKECGKDAKVVNCLVEKDKIDISKETEKIIDSIVFGSTNDSDSISSKSVIERKIDITGKEKIKNSIILTTITPVTKKIGNHSITLISDEEKDFYYDPTNILVLSPTKNAKATIINGSGEYSIKSNHKSTFKRTLELEKLRSYLVDLEQENKIEEAFTEEEVNKTVAIVLDKMKSNSKLVNDAYKEIVPTILEINKEIDKNILTLKRGN